MVTFQELSRTPITVQSREISRDPKPPSVVGYRLLLVCPECNLPSERDVAGEFIHYTGTCGRCGEMGTSSP